jgi:ABC-2 type transport system permease protein
MNKLLLRLVAVFKSLLTRQGIDFAKMIAIVETKLTMDQRRTFVQIRQSQPQKENTNRMQMMLLTYAGIGVFVGLMVILMPSLVVSMSLVHAYIMGMMAMTLITDFSTVLLDTTDNQVLLPKPVGGKTLFMARLIHILIYIAKFTMALSAVPLVCIIIKYGAVIGLVSTVSITLIVLTAVFLSYLLYLFIITFSSERKVKDIITYFQILMIVLFTAGFQVLPRMIDFSELAQDFHLPTAAYFLPPVWMAVVLEGIHTMQFHRLEIGMLLLAVGFPLVSLWVMNKYMAPAFSRKLAAINVDDSSTNTGKQEKVSPVSLSRLFSTYICTSKVERGAFELTWKLTGRDKTFKLRFYPSLGYIVVYIFIFVFQRPGSMGSTFSNLHTTSSYLWFIYTPILVASSSILIIAFSDNYQASWIYYSTPLRQPGEQISGAVKALFVKFLVPVFAIMLTICLFIWGVSILDDFAFGIINNYLCCLIMTLATEHTLPFSKQPTTQQSTGNFLLVLLQMVMVGVLVGIHYLIVRFSFQWLLLVLIPLVTWLSFICTRKLQRLPWSKIVSS